MKNIDELIKTYGDGKTSLLGESDKIDKDHFYNKYSTLANLLGEKLVEISDETAILMYYGIDNAQYLTPVDFVIAQIVFTLQDGKEENVYLQYESLIKSNGDDEAYEYLVNLVKEKLGLQ